MSSSSAESGLDVSTAPQKLIPKPAAHWKLVFDQIHVTDIVLKYSYAGVGTPSDPFIVEYIPHDRRNPMLWPMWKKWSITVIISFSTLAVTFDSSAYSGGMSFVIQYKPIVLTYPSRHNSNIGAIQQQY